MTDLYNWTVEEELSELSEEVPTQPEPPSQETTSVDTKAKANIDSPRRAVFSISSLSRTSSTSSSDTEVASKVSISLVCCILLSFIIIYYYFI